MTEIWKDVVGYEGLYMVSNIGNVKSLNYNKTNQEKIMNQPIIARYRNVHLSKNGMSKYIKVHRLVANAFVENPYNYPIVNHKDEDSLNNVYTNLEWCTIKYNNSYGTRLDRVAQKNKKAVLQYDLNGNFLKEWASASDVQKKLGYKRTNITNCCNGKQKTSNGFVWRYKVL